MLKNWINIFFYHIKNNKLFTVLNVLGLAIGIAGLIFATLYWNDEQSYNEWNPNKNTVFQVLVDMEDGKVWNNIPVTMAPFVKDDSNIEEMMYSENWYQSILYKYNGKKILVEKVFNAENNFFNFFPFEFIKGNQKTALQNENSIAFSQKTAVLFFGTENPIGKQIQYEDQILTVTGIYKVNGNSAVAPDAVVNRIKAKINADKEVGKTFTINLCGDSTANFINLPSGDYKFAITSALNFAGIAVVGNYAYDNVSSTDYGSSHTTGNVIGNDIHTGTIGVSSVSSEIASGRY